MKFYIVNFDRKSNSSYSNFHNEFIQSDIINGWFHYIKSSYIIGSDYSPNEISKHFTSCAEKHGIPTTHIVIEVNISNRQGMLVEKAWKWIKRNDND